MADTLYISGFTNANGNGVVIIDKAAHRRIKKNETALELFKNETTVNIAAITTDISTAKTNSNSAVTIANECLVVVNSLQQTVNTHTSEIAQVKNQISILNDKIKNKIMTVDSSGVDPVETLTTDNGITVDVPEDHTYVFRDINN